jgi:hypothetical protein
MSYKMTSADVLLHNESYTMTCVTDLQGPPLERTQTEKLRDLKQLAQQYARDRVLHFAKRCPTWTMIMWMQPFDDLAVVFGH